MKASAVRWTQDGKDLPDWPVAVRHARRGGASKPLDPGPNHADLSFAEPETTYGARI